MVHGEISINRSIVKQTSGNSSTRSCVIDRIHRSNFLIQFPSNKEKEMVRIKTVSNRFISTLTFSLSDVTGDRKRSSDVLMLLTTTSRISIPFDSFTVSEIYAANIITRLLRGDKQFSRIASKSLYMDDRIYYWSKIDDSISIVLRLSTSMLENRC